MNKAQNIRVLFLFAMEEEEREFRNICNVEELSSRGFITRLAVTGIGKVNAALAAAGTIESFNPDWVVSFGYAGGYGGNAKLGQIIIGTSTFHFDAWCGEPNLRGQIQGMPHKFGLKLNLRFFGDLFNKEEANVSVIATSDHFVTDENEAKYAISVCNMSKPETHENDIITFDMETAAIAQTCYKMGIGNVMAVKIISDVVGSKNQMKDYEESKK